jgi:hypothetical protein
VPKGETPEGNAKPVIITNAGGFGGPEVFDLAQDGRDLRSVFAKYARALFILDQHDRRTRIWEEGAVEVLAL